MKFISFGDIHEYAENVQKIDGITDADFLVITGDLTNVGGIKKAKDIIDFISHYNPNIYAQIGNMDLEEVNNYFDEIGINLHGKGIIIEDVGIFGVGGSNHTPFNTPSEYSEEQLEEFIYKGYESVKNLPIKILVSHTPPYNTVMDIVGDGIHAGSTAVRKFIEEYQPQLCLTGHIHEAIGKDKIGSTIIVNPGMLSNGGYTEIVKKGKSFEVALKKVDVKLT
ncbi:MAG: metallophosphoesterase [Deltaproteobacteria bacterium]|nr:metallophosphoesterase [Deltaproteobacteria bacterium]